MCVHVFPQIKLKRNAYRAVAGGHLCAFRIAYDEPDQVRSRLDVEAGFQSETGTAEAIDGLIKQFHLDNFFAASYKIAVLIKNRGCHGEVVAVAPFQLAEANPF